MNDIYSPFTGEHIWTDNPADWMSKAGVPAPEYDPVASSCFWRGDSWEIVPVTPILIQNPLLTPAQAALDKTDLIALRCLKAGVPYPADWLKYTKDLRAIVNGEDTTSATLPAQPAYPAGT